MKDGIRSLAGLMVVLLSLIGCSGSPTAQADDKSMREEMSKPPKLPDNMKDTIEALHRGGGSQKK